MPQVGPSHRPAGGASNGNGNWNGSKNGNGHGSGGDLTPSSSGSTGSRNSASATPFMPPIAEDEGSQRGSIYGAPPQNIIWPRTPLRVPKKSPRRAIARAQAQAQAQAAASSNGASASNNSSSAAAGAAPPPYVAPNNLPPQYKESPSPSSSDSGDGKKGPEPTGLESLPSSRFTPTPLGGPRPELDEKTPGWMDRQWFGSRRSRYLKFGGLILLAIAIIVGLSVGLTLGLRKGGGSSSNDSPSSSSPKPDPVFPAGFYSFETTLQRISTSCTSRPSTWRCYPYTLGSNATFFWIIKSRDDGDEDRGYTVSSSENPFAPSFSDLTANVLDADGNNERLVFEFDMTKTVVPDDALTPANRAAKCTFGGTRFQATMWTRRGGGSGDDVDTGDKFGAWPGDVEIIQSKQSELGQPKCEDDDGNDIADVQASSGECSCDYANFDMG